MGTWPVEEQFALALHLFESPLGESKLAGVLFLQDFLVDQMPWHHALEHAESLYRNGLLFDWNPCDWFCVRVLGPTIAVRGRACARVLSSWHRASDVWQARASVVGFVKVVAEAAYHPLIVRSCAVLIRRDERFAKTGVGCILHDLSQHDRVAVQAFVEAHLPHFSPKGFNSTLKYWPPAGQRRFLGQLRAVQPQGVAARSPHRGWSGSHPAPVQPLQEDRLR